MGEPLGLDCRVFALPLTIGRDSFHCDPASRKHSNGTPFQRPVRIQGWPLLRRARLGIGNNPDSVPSLFVWQPRVPRRTLISFFPFSSAARQNTYTVGHWMIALGGLGNSVDGANTGEISCASWPSHLQRGPRTTTILHPCNAACQTKDDTGRTATRQVPRGESAPLALRYVVMLLELRASFHLSSESPPVPRLVHPSR
ncbi:hypothetical protein LX32DRAFT_165458 [Colletotrichum zoysiae]|uniref:Uncharacterized protein n=1 Tax=Colletotrichum zoysiae TaxID=1216348 RepID=A0AAD9H6I9_9PEZI|nr:hypothetical protein LX32DRAFT_165458 [Colletotrichum zoysiae]